MSFFQAVSYFKDNYGVTPKEINVPLLYDANQCVFNLMLSPVKDIKEVATHGQGNHINIKIDILKYPFGKSTFSRGPLFTMNFGKSSLWYDEAKLPYYKEMVEKLTKEFDHLLDEDTVLLMPTLPIAAPYHLEMLPYLPSSCYTSIFNVLGLPSTQCPLGINSDGLPYGIQIVGRHYNDPLTVACAVELGKEFGGWVQPGSF